MKGKWRGRKKSWNILRYSSSTQPPGVVQEKEKDFRITEFRTETWTHTLEYEARILRPGLRRSVENELNFDKFDP